MDSRMGFVLDLDKCRMLSIEERRELIHELSKRPESAPEMLQQWSRRDLLEILCAEIGKERKYTGLSKQKLIEHLFKIVSEKRSGELKEEKDALHPPPTTPQTPTKRQRKTDHPSRLPVATNNLPGSDGVEVPNNTHNCENLACRAPLNPGDPFCKRCSCCICYKYDDNKDPSLWLVCSSDILSQGVSCGMSCHLLCALNDERAGITKNGQQARLDGSYYCTYCGKVNDLLGCWRKQLIFAKDARRVDALCQRVSVSHKILSLTEKYQSLHQIVDTAMKKLEAEVGPLNGLPNMARGIVNRLSVGAEVQKLCAKAIELLDSLPSTSPFLYPTIQKSSLMSANFFNFEDVSPTSVTVVISSDDVSLIPPELVVYNLWHKKAGIMDYPKEPTCMLSKSDRRSTITELYPATEYVVKVTAFSNAGEFGKWEAAITTEAISKDDTKSSTNSSGLSNPTSEGDESNNSMKLGDLNQLPENCVGYSEKPDILDFEKSSDKSSMGAEDMKQETPGHSGSALDEEPNSTIQTDSQRDSTNSPENNQASDVPKSDNESNTPIDNQMVVVPYGHSDSALPVTPCRLETSREASGKNGKSKPGCNALEDGPREALAGSSSKKRLGSKCEEICLTDGSAEGVFEYCVKVIRWLECEGHVETDFRKKFLTWFSLRATPQERKIVSVYVDTLIDDPGSLAGQLVDTFSEAIYSKGPPPVRTGFCMRLWH